MTGEPRSSVGAGERRRRLWIRSTILFKGHRVSRPGKGRKTPATAQSAPVQHQDLHILRLIDEGTAAETGAAFFRELVKSLASALDSKYAFVSRFCDANTRVHVLALWNGQGLEENFDYPLPGSPCERVLGGDIVAFDDGIQELFPAEREALKEMNAQSYLAIPLKNRGGDVLGHLAVIDTRAKNWQERDFGILRIFAARCTAEIERQLAEQEMAQANVELARRVRLEALVAETSSRFMSTDASDIDAEISRALGAMGQFIGSDRGVVFRFVDDGNAATLTHEWSLLPQAMRVSDRVPVLSREDVPEVLDHFLGKLTLNAARPELLPAGFDKLNRLLGSNEVTSRIAVPMVFANRTIGFLGFHSLGIERHWPDEDLRLLWLLAEIISGALLRRDTEHALHRAKEAAESANRAKTEFLASMSHELRTPLNGILGYAQLLRRDPALGPEQIESIAAIEGCGEHLLTLIGEVLDLAKIEAGRMDVETGPVNLDDLLHQVADVARIRATQAGLRFTYETLTPLPQVIKTDERKLRQILLNLLGNAVKFTDQGSVCFRVSSAAAAGSHARLRFEVADTGIGIAATEVERIFDPFHQIRERHRPVEGTGLGLAISRRLVALLGGTLRVSSTPALGSTFSVEIEAPVGESALRRATHAAVSIVGYNGRRRRILVADDKEDNRHILGRLLQSLGFEVDEAENGARAVELTIERAPDLVFMDLIMPVKDGMAAIRELRQRGGESARTPIVAVSANAFDDVRADSARVGCDAFIAKPVRLDEVTDVLTRLLHIEWMHGEAGVGPGSVGRDMAGRRLPATLAGDLYELALQGDVHALTQRIATARRDESGPVELLSKLSSMASSYDMKALREFLRPHTEVAR
jgi:two-component system, sensor histidine kinase and response regulator